MSEQWIPDEAWDRAVADVQVNVLRGRVVDVGRWCDRCLLPSAVEVELLLVADCAMFTMPPQYMSRLWCEDCDPPSVS